MKNQNIFTISLILLTITVICMWIGLFLLPFSDIAIRTIGGVMLVDLVILSYSTVKLRNNTK
ncbi:hypothetical protein [Clostridium sp.]|uniref:hypothetical protein n=1 Tax=Clostridium sp. TaxID=1506 RepID=UPI002604BD1C|nr:hypothetical protein [Clostridium sp.]